MKIAFFEMSQWEKERLKLGLKKHKLTFFNHELNANNVKKVKDYDVICIFVDSVVDEEVLGQLKNLKLICTMSTGFDHIDLEACKKVKVANVPLYAQYSVAEHTFALILALSRKIVEAVERTKEGDFDLKGLTGFDLKGKTLGVIGVGNIGKHLIKMAKGFEMNVIANTRKKDKKLAKKLKFKYVTFDNLLKNSDVISLHVPLNDSTKHMINTKNINKIKKGAILVNTARGGIIETSAILKALNSGRLSGVGLDVLEEENAIKEEAELLKNDYDLQTVVQNHVLLNHDKAIITPHNAFNSQEALNRIMDTTIDNIKDFSKGKLKNVCK